MEADVHTHKPIVWCFENRDDSLSGVILRLLYKKLCVGQLIKGMEMFLIDSMQSDMIHFGNTRQQLAYVYLNNFGLALYSISLCVRVCEFVSYWVCKLEIQYILTCYTTAESVMKCGWTIRQPFSSSSYNITNKY